MKESPDDSVPFELGFVMAGAVSAGAYTAGVMDFMLEALRAWQAARDSGQKNVPAHQVKIKVMTGASAGGMTTALSAVEMLSDTSSAAPDATIYRSRMYQAWVKKIDISDLLQTRDLKEGPVRSILDSTRVEEIAREMIDENNLPQWRKIAYVDNELKVYLTLSNLRGLPYEFKLQGATGLPYGMMDHSDYQYVEISEKTTRSDWVKLRNAAVATGAFPIGLSAQLIERDTREYSNRIHKDGRDLSGLLKLPSGDLTPYNFIAVDGGALNNEPIELARSVWERFSEDEKASIKSFKDFEEAQRVMRKRVADIAYAIVMIDPFPNEASFGKNPTQSDTAMSKIIGPLFNALRAQSLFKVEELFRAADKDSNDRFLIAPMRYTETDAVAANPLACGFFNGFGGFIAEQFRQHDYHLGRRNCQRFLQKHFTLPLELVREKYKWKIEPDYIVEETDASGNKTLRYPIIPLLRDHIISVPEEKYPWPSFTKSQSDELKENLDNRFGTLLKKTFPLKWLHRSWVTIVMVALLVIIAGGFFLNDISAKCQCLPFEQRLFRMYTIIIQLIFSFIFISLLVARLGKRLIAKRVSKKLYRMLLSEMNDWGITLKR